MFEQNQEKKTTEARVDSPMDFNLSGRLFSRSLLEDIIRRKEVELVGLKELSKALPLELPARADEAMWEILLKYR